MKTNPLSTKGLMMFIYNGINTIIILCYMLSTKEIEELKNENNSNTRSKVR